MTATVLTVTDHHLVVDLVGTALRQIEKKGTGEVLGTVVAVRLESQSGLSARSVELTVWGNLGVAEGEVVHVRGSLSPALTFWTGDDGVRRPQMRLNINDFERIEG